jgi:hypothetical protein
MTEQYVLLSMEDGRLVQLCVRKLHTHTHTHTQAASLQFAELARLCQRAILHTLTWCGGSDAQNASGQASVVSDIDALHDTIDKVELMRASTCSPIRCLSMWTTWLVR